MAAVTHVLVRCTVSDGGSKDRVVPLNLPVEDRLMTIGDLSTLVSSGLTNWLHLENPTKRRGVDISGSLYWLGKPCEDDRELDYYMPAQNPLVLTTDAMIYNKDSERSCRAATECCAMARMGAGFSVPFTDVSNPAAMKKIQWAESGPSWYTALPGLCVEGVCANVGCAAYNQWVIDNRGQGTFDLIIDAHNCKCPMCRKPVKPVTCAFNNCQWRFMGLKVGAAEAVRSDGWTDAGNWCAFAHFTAVHSL